MSISVTARSSSAKHTIKQSRASSHIAPVVQFARIDGQRTSRRSLSRHSLTRRNCHNDRILASPRTYARLSVRDYIHIYLSTVVENFPPLLALPVEVCRCFVYPNCVAVNWTASARGRITRCWFLVGEAQRAGPSMLQNVVRITVRGIQTQPRLASMHSTTRLHRGILMHTRRRI